MIYKNGLLRIIIPIIFIILILGSYFYKKKIEPTLNNKSLLIIRTSVVFLCLVVAVWTFGNIFL